MFPLLIVSISNRVGMSRNKTLPYNSYDNEHSFHISDFNGIFATKPTASCGYKCKFYNTVSMSICGHLVDSF